MRAIHIQLVPDMSTETFIQALDLFFIVYSTPTHLCSDDARSFFAALGRNIIKHHINSPEFCNAYTNSSIKHIKIP